VPPFDVESTLQRHRVHYVTSGPNTARGNIGIKCPWCRDDQSEHLGIRIDGPFAYGCWRNKNHRGTSMATLFAAVLGISRAEAMVLVGTGGRDLGNYDRALAALQGALKDNSSVIKNGGSNHTLTIPKHFRMLKVDGYSKPYLNYLYRRGYRKKDIAPIVKKYGLMYCTSGYWKNRIIMPVYIDKELVSWTGRTIRNDEEIRYKSLTTDIDKAQNTGGDMAKMSIADCIGFFDNLMKKSGNKLFITEGPFDGLWLDYHLRKTNCRATCLFGKILTDNKKWLLDRLASKFDDIIVLLDQKELASSIELIQDLSIYKARTLPLPNDVSDPAELSIKQIKELSEK